ncbi:glycosyltransferase [[Clostridium] innocuum]|nr:glycosyltransferase [[Clostridium] innocuum]
MKKQSIIIPFHKDKNMLFYSLKTLMATIDEEIEVIIVGNNMNYDEIDFDIPFPNCKYYKIKENLFYPKAINYGVSKCNGDIITLCDPDIFYTKGWYKPLLKMIDKDTVGSVSSKLINPCNGRIMEYGVYFSKYNAIHAAAGLKKTHRLASIDRKAQAACSAILMTKKDLFFNIGGMDHDLPFAYTDFDYCIKLNKLGYDTWIASDSEVYHKGNTDPNNSKYYSFGYLRTECKGMFYAKDFSKLSLDFMEWFKVTADYFKDEHPEIENKFMLVDLSTMYNRDEFYNIIQNVLNVEFLDYYQVNMKTRNVKDIALHNTISFNLIDLNTPILLFVDTFLSLFNNRLWFNLRDISKDIVVDKNGNFLMLSDIANGDC